MTDDDYQVNTRYCIAVAGHMIDMATISTAELAVELKSRGELGPIINDMEEPICLFVTNTKSLVAELSKRDVVKTHEISSGLIFEVRKNRRMTLGADKTLDEGEGPCTILVIKE